MTFKKIFCLLSCTCLGIINTAFAQNYPKDQFRSPIDTTISLAGNFGELRANHYHSGLDIRTGNREGMAVYAVGDGYVSRIRVSPYGYGKSLYITHPNGYVSVYGHLRSFNGALASYLLKKQYEKESFEVDLYPIASELPVKKSDLVAFSGNTGGSTGPHLHFEIRDAATEEVINPLNFGFPIKDKEKPTMTALSIYPSDFKSLINGQKSIKNIPLVKKDNRYVFKNPDTLTLQGNIFFGIECYDRESASSGKNGVYSIELKVDSQTVYFYKIDRFAFSETRYANRHVDYAERQKNGKNVQISSMGTCNLPALYQNTTFKGNVAFVEGRNYSITYTIKDFFGNTSQLSFKAKGVAVKSSLAHSPEDRKLSALLNDTQNNISCEAASTITRPNISCSFPINCFYDDQVFDSKIGDTLKGTLTAVYQVMKDNIPLQLPCTLSIKASIPEKYQSKAVMVSLDEKNRKYPLTTEYKEGWLIAQTKELGRFTAVLDTTSPVIKPINILKGKNMSAMKSIELKAMDNLSGIKNYRATIDGKWILMEYEPKKNLFFYTFAEVMTSDTHTFTFEVSDYKDNKNTFTTTFSK